MRRRAETSKLMGRGVYSHIRRADNIHTRVDSDDRERSYNWDEGLTSTLGETSDKRQMG